MNIIDIVRFKYPSQIEMRNVYFRNPYETNDILIDIWTVPNEARPTEQELIDFGVLHERAININSVSIECINRVETIINSTAQTKSYRDGVSCASYSASTNELWQAESLAFIAWRDSVWNYLYDLLAEVSGGSEPIPSVQEIINGLPQMVWPN